MNAEQLAQVGDRLVRRSGTRDPFQIAEDLGVITMYRNDLGRLKGMSSLAPAF